ncbi:MAG: DUF4241 domain-containing protein [Cyanobacteriota bacterium]|nr:DUF4241 domain-containing protein [Cyanobacteriota bacterium]
MNVPNFLLAFNPGQELILNSSKMTLNPHPIGELVLTSGNLIVCDPLYLYKMPPFSVQFSPGRYPVILSLGWEDGEKFPTVVCAMLCLKEENPVRWEIAVEPSQDPDSPEETLIYRYGVDSGTSSFMDEDAFQAMDDSFEGETTLGDLLIDELEKEENFQRWANMLVDEATDANVVAFSSGFGDSYYDCYFGYDKEGNIVRVVTDFLFSN